MPPKFRGLLICLCSIVLLLSGCASGGGSAPSAVDAGSGQISDAAGQAMDATSQAKPETGTVKRMMQAIGLAKPAEPAPTERQLPLRMFTAQNLNAGQSNKPLALVVMVYHLRSMDRFKLMSFDDFLDKAKTQSVLGDDLIDSREMLLLPAQRYISTEHMSLDTRYLGFVAFFRAPAASRWRFAYDVGGSVASGITLGVHGCAMSSTAGALMTELPDSPGSLASVHCSPAGR